MLQVDDEELVRGTANRILERLGFTALVAVDGHNAIRCFRNHADKSPGTILDLTMLRLGREDTFRELRRISPNAGVILCSGYNQQNEFSAVHNHCHGFATINAVNTTMDPHRRIVVVSFHPLGPSE